MKQSTLEALLGRPLTSIESSNQKLYLKIAKERLEDLLCMNLTETTEDRIFDIREGYATVFTDLFTEVSKVVIDDEELSTTEYAAYQWNRRNADWYNSIVLEDKHCENGKDITITADWGGVCAPELQLLLAQLFGLIGKMNAGNGNVKSKKVEDFSISFNDNTVYEQFLLDNAATINKYSICGISQIRSGKTRRHWERY